MDVRVSSGMKELELYLLQVESLDVSRLHLGQLLSCHIEVDFNLSIVVVDLLLVLHKAAQVLDVSLQEHLLFKRQVRFHCRQNVMPPLQKEL